LAMTIAICRPLTVEEYLACAGAQPERQRTELINGQIVAMAPERVEHGEVKLAAAIALRTAVARAGLDCHALGDGMTVRIDDHTAYEPDALVYCGERLARGSMIVPAPVIVVEVLSPTTAHTDTSAKLIGYFKLPSVMHYLVLDPEARSVTHHGRDRLPEILAAGHLRLDPPGLHLAVDDLLGAA
jgi:Uma2 family endonuclease